MRGENYTESWAGAQDVPAGPGLGVRYDASQIKSSIYFDVGISLKTSIFIFYVGISPVVILFFKKKNLFNFVLCALASDSLELEL